MGAFLEETRNIVLLAIGFGFVVFWHELGHFLAAKWAGVKVEQFAVGFGQAVLSWRRGIGLRYGSTQKEFRKRIEDHLVGGEAKPLAKETPATAEKGDEKDKTDDESDGPTDLQVATAASELGLGETEYRLNWIPLGGYVKMLGQDDMKPNAEADDPRAFNRQSIGKRMVIVSAGVIMNVILAAIGFMVLFLVGFHVTPAMVGVVLPGSPAQKAGLLPGDKILAINGRDQHDEWTKVQLNAALCSSDETTPVTVERIVDGKVHTVTLQIVAKRGSASKEFNGFGIMPAEELLTPTPKELKDAGEITEDKKTQALMFDKDMLAVEPGEAIVAVNGQPVNPDPDPKTNPGAGRAFLVLDNALQQSGGKPVAITVAADEGKGARRDVNIQPHFMDPFSEDPLNFAGMVPRVKVIHVPKDSQAFGALMPGDVITHVGTSSGGANAALDNPSIKQFRQRMNDAGKNDSEISIGVLRDGQIKSFDHLHATKIDTDNYGLKIGVGYDENHSVVADELAGSASQKAKIPAQATILKVGKDAVASWFDVQTTLKKWADANKGANPLPPIPVTYKTEGGEQVETNLELNGDEVAAIDSYRYRADLELESQHGIRQTGNPITAAKWGVEETRDFIVQFYLTLNRMRSGDVSPKNMMGPLGIFQAGTTFAAKGNDWLIWFLSMISANLAVVNFLPIPIVDGGLFTFLVLEKLKGRPLSAKTQAVAQYVGMALLLGIVLFVTWQDVLNFPFRRH